MSVHLLLTFPSRILSALNTSVEVSGGVFSEGVLMLSPGVEVPVTV